MTPERYEEIGKLYQAALEREPSARAAFLAEACPTDDELRVEVESLLAAHERAAEFIEEPPHDIAAGWQAARVQEALDDSANLVTANQSAVLTGRSVGHYEVVSLIGRGGMGEVYRARDTRLDRTVALKLLPSQSAGAAQSQVRFLREARLAATLDHPNICTVFDAGESNGLLYIAMQYLEGQSLRSLIGGRPMTLQTVLSIGIQIAEALAAAHHRDIIHRDIKPENVIITDGNKVKVLDFGLAKTIVDTGPNLTRSDCLIGTPAYMSPEQARGGHVDRRSDIFSFGVVLYEMVTGKAPFRRESSVETMHAIIEESHVPVRHLNSGVSPDFAAIIDRCLAKAAGDRYSTMDEAAAALRRITTRRIEPQTAVTRKNAIAAVVALMIIVIMIAGWFVVRLSRETQAREQIARIEELANQRRFKEAYDLAQNTIRILPTDPKLTRLMRALVNTFSVTSDPPGAKVFLRAYVDGADPAAIKPEFVGTTPLSNLEIAHGEYIVHLELDGYASVEGSIRGYNNGDVNAPLVVAPTPLNVTLIATAKSPSNMVYVPGGDYRLVSWRRPSDASVKLDGFFIDKYEVSNQEYKEFVSSGGYLRKEFWKYPLMKNGREIPWTQAMREFVDRTQLPGPRGWSNQEYPSGKERHPVTGISWYEAAAYAAFRGKTLPTIFQWEKAARDPAPTPVGNTMPWGLSRKIAAHANLSSTGTAEVGSFEFGMSPFGAYDMAGNVAEWLVNDTSDGFLTSGGSWSDPAYAFGGFGPFPPFFSSDRLGFRCVLNSPNAATDQGAFRIQLDNEVPQYTPAPETQARAWINEFSYEKTPLDASVIERIEANDWTREKISFTGARGARALAYLYLPKHFPKPFQVIHIVPGADALTFSIPMPRAMEQVGMGFVRAGRAVFAVVLQGMAERENPQGFVLPPFDSPEYTEFDRARITDTRRGLDYLESRDDIAMNQLGFYFVSAANTQWLLPEIDARYRSVAAFGAAIPKVSITVTQAPFLQLQPRFNPINFFQFIQAPVLLVHGRYDEVSPAKSGLEPLVALLRTRKRVEFFDGGHIPPPEFLLPLLNSWFDETLGTVRR